MNIRIRADAEFALDAVVVNASQVMFDIRIASAPAAGPLALAELGARHGILAGSFVQNDDGSYRTFGYVGEKLPVEEFAARQRKLVKEHVARHPHGGLARALAAHSATARALGLGLPRAAPRPATPRHASTGRTPRAPRRTRCAASRVARSPDEPPNGEGGDAPRRCDERGAR